jgi:hypothetical protein
MTKLFVRALLLPGLAVMLAASVAQAAEFKIGIMQDVAGVAQHVAQQYGPLVDLFKANSIEVKLQGYSNYTDAALKFENGEVDAMFAGSGSDKELLAKVESVLYGLEANTSTVAAEAKKSLNVAKYIPTSEEDFKHTLGLLERAAVTPEFDFSY